MDKYLHIKHGCDLLVRANPGDLDPFTSDKDLHDIFSTADFQLAVPALAGG